MRKGRALCRLGVCTAILVFAGPATAQNIAEEIQFCINDRADDERRVAACSVALASGRVVERADLLLRRASLYYERGDFELALADLDDAIADGGGNYRALMIRGSLQVARRRFTEAAADYAEAVTLRPMEAEPYLRRGEALLRQGKPEAAIVDFDAAIKLEPMSATAYANRGVAHGELGAFARAVEDLTTAIDHQESEAHLYALRGGMQRRLGKYAQALGDFESAAKLDASFDSYITVGDLLLAGRNEAALARLAETNDFYELASLITNRYYESLWRDPRAAPYLRGEAIVARVLAAARDNFAARPDDLETLARLLQALNMNGRFEETLTLTERLPADIIQAPSRPVHVAILDHYTDALRRLGRHDDANAILARIAALSLDSHPFLAEENVRYADQLVDQGRFEEALRIVANAEAFLPENGRGVAIGVRVCANAHMGRNAEGTAALSEFSSAAALERFIANICLRRLEDAGIELMRLMENEDTRALSLIQKQDCIESPLMPALYRETMREARAVRDSASVRAVIERFGVIGFIPVHC